MLCSWCGRNEIDTIEDSHGICRPCLHIEFMKSATTDDEERLWKEFDERCQIISKIQDPKKREQAYSILCQLIKIIDKVVEK